MCRFCFSIAAWVVCISLLIVPQVHGAVEFGDLVVTTKPAPGGVSSHGYVEYRILVTNRSPERTHRVTLILPGTRFSQQGNYIREILREGIVSPSSTMLVTLLQPPLPLYGNGLAVIIDGQPQRGMVPLHFSQHWRYNNALVILISRSVVGDFQLTANKAFEELENASIKPTVPPSREERFEFTQSELPVTDWSGSWLGYSRFDGIVVTSDDLRSMPTSVQSALWSYVESGGSLLILGSWQVPESWRWRQEIKNDFYTYYGGFGQCIVSPSADVRQWNYSQWLYVRDSWLKTFKPWQTYRDSVGANAVFPVVEDLRIPVRGLFLLILFFVTMVGPVNLFVLSRKKKRIWLLWTVPILSLVTCVAVFVYATFVEGWGAHARTAGLTILDETSHRATTIGWTAFYAPLTPGDGLHFGYETELTPLLGHSWDGGTARTLDWTKDQHLVTGWMTARVPAHFMVRKSEVRRERLVVGSKQDGSLTIINGLGADIRNLWLANKEGKIYSATRISAGAQAVLMPAEGSPRVSGTLDGLRQAFVSEWTGNLEGFTKNPEKFLVPGCYIALLDAAPFIEEGLGKVKFRKSQAVVYGIMKRRGVEEGEIGEGENEN